MGNRINFEAKTDRELLILVAQQSNEVSEEKIPAIQKQLETLNGTVRNHESRITKVETKQKMNRHNSNPGSNPGVQNKLLDKLTSIGGGWVAAILTIAALIAIVYHVGCVFSWWG